MNNEGSQRALLAPALRAFFRLAEEWQLDEAEQMILLGSPTASHFQAWRRGGLAGANGEVLERISLLLGIYRAIHTLLPEPARANLWIRAKNSAPMFGGRSALDHMLAGGIVKLRQVRAHLAAQFG